MPPAFHSISPPIDIDMQLIRIDDFWYPWEETVALLKAECHDRQLSQTILQLPVIFCLQAFRMEVFAMLKLTIKHPYPPAWDSRSVHG